MPSRLVHEHKRYPKRSSEHECTVAVTTVERCPIHGRAEAHRRAEAGQHTPAHMVDWQCGGVTNVLLPPQADVIEGLAGIWDMYRGPEWRPCKESRADERQARVWDGAHVQTMGL